MKTFMLSDVDSPQVVFEVGGHEIESTVIKNVKKTPNFDRPLLFLDVVRFLQSFFDCHSQISRRLDVTQRRSLRTTDEYQSQRSSIIRKKTCRGISRD